MVSSEYGERGNGRSLCHRGGASSALGLAERREATILVENLSPGDELFLLPQAKM